MHLRIEIRHNNLNPYAAGHYFCKYKIMQKSWKITETLANGYSSESTQRELSNEYQHDRVLIVFKDFGILVLWMKVASALEGLNMVMAFIFGWNRFNYMFENDILQNYCPEKLVAMKGGLWEFGCLYDTLPRMVLAKTEPLQWDSSVRSISASQVQSLEFRLTHTLPIEGTLLETVICNLVYVSAWTN